MSTRRRNRNNSPDKPNADETVSATMIQHTNPQQGSSKKPDNPVVLLSRTNYVEFIQGLVSYMTQKEGGADLKFYLENEGQEPNFDEDINQLKTQYKTFEAERQKLSSRCKRMDKDLSEAKSELRAAKAQLRAMHLEFKTQKRTGEAMSELTNSPDRAEEPEQQQPESTPGPFSFSRLRAATASKKLEDDDTLSTGSSETSYNTLQQAAISDQGVLILDMKIEISKMESDLEDAEVEESNAQIEAKLIFQALDASSKDIAIRKRSFKKAKLSGLYDLLDTMLFIPPDKKAEIKANTDLNSAILQARDDTDLYGVIHLITQGYQFEEEKSAWQLIELK